MSTISVTARKLKKGCSFRLGNVEDFRQPLDDLCRRTPFFRFDFMDGGS
jgi:hypothetical protein